MQKSKKELIQRLAKDAESAQELNQLFDDIAVQYPSADFIVDYEQFCAAIPQAVIIYDRDHNISYVNHAAEVLLGYTAEALRGQHLMHPDWQVLNEKLQPLRRGDYPVFDTISRNVSRHDVTIYMHRADRTCLKILMSSEPLHHKLTKRLMGAIAILTDDSEGSSLYNVRERERTRVLSEFLTGASQQIRTPLATIHSKLHLMTRKHEELIDSREMIAINNSLDRIVTLIDKLELMLKLEDCMGWTQYGLNLNKLLESIINNHRYMYAGTIRLEADQPNYMVIANQELVVTAVNELVANAIAFSPDFKDIVLRIRHHAKWVYIEVIDQGIGMNDETLAKACERFFRGEAAQVRPGYGLGLTLVKRIIKVHTNKMQIESTPCQGTTVSISLLNMSRVVYEGRPTSDE